jgi:hypothetical protein
MSRSWNPSIFRIHDAQSAPTDPGKVEGMMQGVDDCCRRLQSEPYNPSIWLARAAYHLALNYPELAAGDAYKASILMERNPIVLAEYTIIDTWSKIHDVLGQALYDCHCHWELAEFWEAVATKFPSDRANAKATSIKGLVQRKSDAAASMGGTLQEQRDRVRDGGVVTVDYPWTQPQHLTRSRELISIVNEELGHDKQQQTCYLARSTLTESGDMLGMFAAQDVEPGERILLDRTATGICSNVEPGSCDNCFGSIRSTPIHASCCKANYCSADCRSLAIATYHKVLCGQDFGWVREPARDLKHNASPLRPLLMLRFIATCIQAGPDIHPLDHPLIARLQPLSNRSHVEVFTFNESIVIPSKILHQLGVDQFSNSNFDTMVLLTIWARIANNKAGSPDPGRGFIDEISPHLPLFNHSCDPNIEWRRGDGSTTIWFLAKKRIAKDEELFSSYLGVQKMSFQDRAAALWPWFEGPCLCSKCAKERMSM